jgi:hypothetical protein
MEQLERTKEEDDHKGRPPDLGGPMIEVEAEIEDQPEPYVFTTGNDGGFIKSIREHVGAAPEMEFFERDHDEPLTAPPHGRKAIRIVGHRCHVIMVTVRYEHRTIEHRFTPSATVFKVLQWAVSKRGFDLDPTAAAKANLILPGADGPLPRDAVIGKFVKAGHCTLVVDLTLKDFTNG